MRAFRLAYVELETGNLETTVGYYRDVLGASAAEIGTDCAYLSLGLDGHNFAIRRGERPALRAIGLEITAGSSSKEIATILQAQGIQAMVKSDPRPGVASMVEVGVGGHVFELFSGMTAAAPGFSGRGVAPLKLGHLALLSDDALTLDTFLRRHLGFNKTDQLEELATFYTCNADHHVLNVVAAPVSTLHHVAFQLDGRDHQFRAADVLASHGVPTLWGPARHTAGHNVATYHRGADGVLVELYSDMDVFVPELGRCEPRPWHADLPQVPKRWPLDAVTRWETRYEFDLATAAFGLDGVESP